MNSLYSSPWLGAATGAKYRIFRKSSDIAVMGAANAFVFIDEHPDSINYGDFAVAMNDGVPDASVVMVDVPASYHNGAGGLSFADGHADTHLWRDARTKMPITGIYSSIGVRPSPGNVDMRYLSDHSSVRQ